MLAAQFVNTTNDIVVYTVAALAVLAQVFVLAIVVLRIGAFWKPKAYDYVADQVGSIAIPLAFVVTLTATSGSLYFSEVIHWRPCNFCWYQRIAIYPQAVILGIATFMRRTTVIPYVIGLAIVTLPFSVYHYALEIWPQLESAACDPNNPCSIVYVAVFDFGFLSRGYMTIPMMAGTASLTAIVLMLLAHRYTKRVAAAQAETA